MKIRWRASGWFHSSWLGFAGLCFAFGFGLWFSIPAARPLFSATPVPIRPPVGAATATPSTQAGHGRDVFYLHCMPCHGDQGQGLTDEFRLRQYPTEDTNCWKSGCHGDRPYDNGFTLPKTIPALIGSGTLQHFNTAKELFGFISKAMPFNAPGSLSQDQYLQLMAFLLESNGVVPAGAQFDAASLDAIHLRNISPTPASSDQSSTSSAEDDSASIGLWGLLIFLIVATALSIVTRRRR